MTELTTDFILDCLPIIIPNIGAIVQFLNRIMINDKVRDIVISVYLIKIQYMKKKLFLMLQFANGMSAFILQLKDLFDQIKIDWECAKSQNEIEIMQTNAKGARVTTKLFLRK